MMSKPTFLGLLGFSTLAIALALNFWILPGDETDDLPAARTAPPASVSPPLALKPGEEGKTSGGAAVTPPRVSSTEPVGPPTASVAPSEAPAAIVPSAPTKPSFDIVRVDPEGNAVIAGRGAPNREVAILDADQEIGRVTTDDRGEWVFIPPTKLDPGERVLSLRETASGDAPAVESDEAVVLVIPEPGKDIAGRSTQEPSTPLALVLPRGKAETGGRLSARILQAPVAGADGSGSGAPAAEATVSANVAPPSSPAPSTDLATPSGAAFSSAAVSSDPAATGDGSASQPIPAPGSGTARPSVSASVAPATRQPMEAAAPVVRQPAETATPSARQPAEPATLAARQPAYSSVPEAPKPVASAFPEAVDVADQQGDGPDTSVDVIDYDDKGSVVFSGRTEPGAEVEVFIDNEKMGAATADTEGRWRFQPATPVEPGNYKLRVDRVDSAGVVRAQVALPFVRANPLASLPAGRLVVIQPGNNLWRISAQVYGSGFRYVQIYDANQDQIRDPDLIYPGQVFELPRVN